MVICAKLNTIQELFLDTQNHKPLHNIDAEQSVIGSLLKNSGVWDDVISIINADDFQIPKHKVIFNAIEKMIAENEKIDVLTVSSFINSADIGLQYLAEIAANTPSFAHVKTYAGIVKDRSLLQSLASVHKELGDTIYDSKNNSDVNEVINDLEKNIFEISQKRRSKSQGAISIRNLLGTVVEKMETMTGGGLVGNTTGFNDLDKLTSGLQNSDLIIVAGRPSMGKTAFSMNIAENMSGKIKKPIIVFSMEMPSDQLCMRMMSSLGSVSLGKIRSGDLEDDDWGRLAFGMSQLNKRNIFIEDTANMSVQEIMTSARNIAREHGDLGLIVIDYLQLMKASNSKMNRTDQVSEFSRGLKILAKELNVPVIALSQLNRNLEQRPNKRPVMADLRESGAIEQDADLIMFVYRDEVYNENSEDKGFAEIIIGKQRNGELGTVRLTFQGQYTKFNNFIGQYETKEDY